MSSKASVIPAVKAHFDTFRDDSSDGSVHLPDYAVFLGVPLGAAALVVLGGVRLKELSGFLGGLAVFTALLFGLVIFVFQLRLQLRTDGEFSAHSALVRLIDQLFANVNYAVVVGVVTTAVGVIAAATLDSAKGTPVWMSAVLTALAMHLVLTIFMCVKRVHSAYRQLSF